MSLVCLLQQVNVNRFSSNTLQLPSKSVPSQRQGHQDSHTAIRAESTLPKSHDQSPALSHDSKAQSGTESDGGDESFSVGDQTLTGDNENEQKPKSQGQGQSKWGENGSPTEEDSCWTSEEDDESDAVVPQGRTKLVGQTRRTASDSARKTDRYADLED